MTAPSLVTTEAEHHFERMHATPALEHIRSLDEKWARFLRGERPPSPLSRVPASELPPVDTMYDAIYAGGGLGLLHALALQQRGWRVLLFDQGAVGATHREWNITRGELDVLVRAELFSWDELGPVVAREYRNGFIRFHNPGGAPAHLDLPGVLDLALDASALLTLARDKFEKVGGTVWEQTRFEHVWVARDGAAEVVVRVRGAQEQPYHIGARLLLNAMGALSPLSLALAPRSFPFDGVCPTVGTVARGFADGEVDPSVGEILLTLDGAQEGRQLIWEGFPGRGDTFTTYLFYYDITEECEREPHALLPLFAEYFRLLPRYKQPGPVFEHLKPVYGFIPSRHHLDGSPSERGRTARAILSIGDAAARQNPLTFTGFGSFVRHLPSSVERLDLCLRDGDLEADTLANLGAGQSNLEAMWVMARFLGMRRGEDDVNAILRDFTRALQEVGAQRAAHFFLDRASWQEYVEIMLRTARHRPKVFVEAFEVLGARGVAHWLEDLARWWWTEKRAAEEAANS